MQSLKPCPFCGSAAELLETIDGEIVACLNSHCGVHQEAYIRWTGNDWEIIISAEDKWNNRNNP